MSTVMKLVKSDLPARKVAEMIGTTSRQVRKARQGNEHVLATIGKAAVNTSESDIEALDAKYKVIKRTAEIKSEYSKAFKSGLESMISDEAKEKEGTLTAADIKSTELILKRLFACVTEAKKLGFVLQIPKDYEHKVRAHYRRKPSVT